jgi:hypothetical protein
MYRLVNDIRKEFKRYTTACRESTGMILNEPSEIMERWKNFFQNLVRDLSINKYGDHPRIGRSGKKY